MNYFEQLIMCKYQFFLMLAFFNVILIQCGEGGIFKRLTLSILYLHLLINFASLTCFTIGQQFQLTSKLL